MNCKTTSSLVAATGIVAVLAMGGAVRADESLTPAPDEDLRRLERLIFEQRQKMAQQERDLIEFGHILQEQQRASERQNRLLENLSGRFDSQAAVRERGQFLPAVVGEEGSGAPPARMPQMAQAEEQPTPVGEAPPPKAEAPRELAGVREVGGVLTPPGVLVVENQLQYSQSNVNRFFFQGVEIVETVLIGVIEATDSDRDTLTTALALRYGLFDRVEIEARLSFVRRDDRVIRRIISSQEESTRNLEGNALGDFEASVRYQINRGRDDWPILIANLRYKSDTGIGPFDVDRDADGIETELPTGSGFIGVQPGLTALYPSDPAVFFANVNYLWNVEKAIDEEIGGNFIGDVDPGDVIGGSMGVSFALNERSSLSLAYEHNFILATISEINGVVAESETLDVGLLRIGVGFRLTDRIGLNLNVSAGVTDDAPDITIALRTSMRFNLF